jgi:FlaA1/EpsC-like NDP-sugar epimerase
MIQKIFKRVLDKFASRWTVLAIDLALVFISFVIAYFIKYNLTLSFDYAILLSHLPYILVFYGSIFLIIGTHKSIIRHSGLRDTLNIFTATTISTSLLLLLVLTNAEFKLINSLFISKSILIIHYLVSSCLLILSRFITKSFYEVITTRLVEVKSVLIYGAGDLGIITLNALNKDTENNYEIVGFIDDSKKKVGKKIDRVKIYNLEKIDINFVKKHNIETVIIAIKDLNQNKMLSITDKFINLDIDVKIIPHFSALIDGNLEPSQIRQIKIEDLLNRAPINIENPVVQKEVNGKVVLVTGAAGSIGSEISRQLSTYNCKFLVLIDQGESALYDLEQELIQNGFTNFIAVVSDVRDHFKVDRIFKKYKPNHLFHTAAYKHIPLMEKSPYEAVKVNVLGTKNIADLSIEHNIERFVMFSTDKAVNPTNVMGASKRIAELYINCLSKEQNNTKFTIARFGNVLGSNGSVVPLFKKQIKKGGPITLTHKNITRFFMTITEACSLALEAATMGKGGEIYIFDMGKPVRIYDIAKRMIHLSGLKYPKDIKIEVIGLRPGEKLQEELIGSGESTKKTYHNKIMIIETKKIDYLLIKEKINSISGNFRKLNNEDLVIFMKDIVPEYLSNNSEFEKLDSLKF